MKTLLNQKIHGKKLYWLKQIGIKQNLKDEISLLTKIIYNYNQNFLNYTYYSIFNAINDYIANNRNNEILEKLKNSKDFEEKKEIIFEYINLNKVKFENKIEYKRGYLDLFYSLGDGIIEKINNKYYFEYFNNEKKFYISEFNKKEYKITYYGELPLSIDDEINSYSISKESNQIYICFLNKRIVNIIDYDLNNLDNMKSNIAITDENNSLSHFNKCIKIKKRILATSDDRNINIWYQTNDNLNHYTNIKNINIYGKTSDLILANDEYFVSSQPNFNIITIIDLRDFCPERYITNIDCIDSFSCFLLFKEYIIINCKKGIALLFIKTKEITQYIENFYGMSEKKHIILDNKENICFINVAKKQKKYSFKHRYTLTLIKLKLNDGLLEAFEEYENIESYQNISKIICINNGDFIMRGHKAYILKEENKIIEF